MGRVGLRTGTLTAAADCFVADDAAIPLGARILARAAYSIGERLPGRPVPFGGPHEATT